MFIDQTFHKNNFTLYPSDQREGGYETKDEVMLEITRSSNDFFQSRSRKGAELVFANPVTRVSDIMGWRLDLIFQGNWSLHPMHKGPLPYRVPAGGGVCLRWLLRP